MQAQAKRIPRQERVVSTTNKAVLISTNSTARGIPATQRGEQGKNIRAWGAMNTACTCISQSTVHALEGNYTVA